MRIFIREQLPLIVLYFLQLFIVTAIYLLDGYHHLMISLYTIFLSTCLLAGYLCYRYITNRSFYRLLERPLSAMEDFKNEVGKSPLSESLQQLLMSQFAHYRADIHHYKYKLEDHIQFINQWVHQMKTPISVIHLIIQNEDDARFHAIGDELERLRKGLEMVLYTARLDLFERDFYVETLELEKIVRMITSSQKRLFIRNHVFPSINIPQNLTITSDEKWLSFVITQLITNAVKYTIGENKKIYFYGYKHGNHQILEVQDQGVGIQQADLPRVFEPYFTGENGRQFQESTGMGLYLAKQICEKLGHQLEIESTLGEGTTVRIIF
ncbi:sensor histidine kinase [Heyndrickxia ginsengihumi]|uniref:histidine kinase n=1 Tax=Heyndrickxia ginsengihumi TaxID=363870 RepID=A0A0A6VC88_9BACI|nr:sensor histidine kinase [Heyndrickxia ginsengihumi]KHD85845.1 membrane protein [Heyndrickxia ginsengihumi]MBE6185663.1 HAMP domain-containing histidine kinase [Bacillus sp. (in: firmicutes)]NEY21245.1 HAMP domain-containing histidine kinase [Heyndrickxia ginsengihumi]